MAGNGNSKESLKNYEETVTAMCWSSDGRYLLTTDKDGNVKRWTEDGELITSRRLLSGGIASCLSALPQTGENTLAYCDLNGAVYLQDYLYERSLRTVEMDPIEKLLTVGSQPHEIYCLSKKSEFHSYDVRCAEANRMKFDRTSKFTSFDVCQSRSQLVAMGCRNGCVHVYDTRFSWKPLMLLSSAENALSEPKIEKHSVKNVHFDYGGTEIIMNDGFGIAYRFELNSTPSNLKPALDRISMNGVPFPKKSAVIGKMPESRDFRRVIASMRLSFHEREYTEALAIGVRIFKNKEITDNKELSVMRKLNSECYTGRGWPRDEWMALREIVEAYLLNSGNDGIHYDLIQRLAACDLYQYALSAIRTFKKNFKTVRKPFISAMESQMNKGKKKMERTPMREPILRSYIDYKQRYVGINDRFTDCIDVQYLGFEERYIVSTTSDGQAIVYDKKTSEINHSIEDFNSPIAFLKTNPVQPMFVSAHPNNRLSSWRQSSFTDNTESDDISILSQNFDPRIFWIDCEQPVVEDEKRLDWNVLEL